MKFLFQILLASMILVSGTSPANPSRSLGYPSHLNLSAPIAIKNVSAYAISKLHLTRTKKQQAILLTNLNLEDDDDDFGDEIDLQVLYRRPRIVQDNDELPIHITDRLAQIRELAMAKYREVHGTS